MSAPSSSRWPTRRRRSTRCGRGSTPRSSPRAGRTCPTRSTTCWRSPASSAACSTPGPPRSAPGCCWPRPTRSPRSCATTSSTPTTSSPACSTPLSPRPWPRPSPTRPGRSPARPSPSAAGRASPSDPCPVPFARERHRTPRAAGARVAVMALPDDLPLSFDALTEDALRSAGSVKWTLYGDAIGAFVAEMDFGTAPAVTAALHRAVDENRFGYLPPQAALAMAESCAAWQGRRYGWEVPAEWVTPLPDVVAGLQAAIEYFTPPGSPIVLPTPAYMPFLIVPGLMQREIIEVPLVPGDDGRLTYDLDGLDRAFAAGGRLLVHCNPHNPVGRVFTEDEQLALAEVVERHGVRVFSDEIHAPLIYPGAVHRPYASLSPVTAGHTVTATSASKAWNLPGLKAAQFLVSNEADAAYWAEKGFFAAHGAAHLGVIANTAAYTHGEAWLDVVLAYLDRNRRLLAELLADRVPEVGYTMPEGTYLAWLDCRALGIEGPAGDFFLERAGVALIDGPECGSGGAGHVRLTFATPRPVLETIVDRLATALGR